MSIVLTKEYICDSVFGFKKNFHLVSCAFCNPKLRLLRLLFDEIHSRWI